MQEMISRLKYRICWSNCT